MVVLGRVLYVKGRLSRGYVRSDFVLILGGVKGCFSSDFVWYRTEVGFVLGRVLSCYWMKVVVVLGQGLSSIGCSRGV